MLKHSRHSFHSPSFREPDTHYKHQRSSSLSHMALVALAVIATAAILLVVYPHVWSQFHSHHRCGRYNRQNPLAPVLPARSDLIWDQSECTPDDLPKIPAVPMSYADAWQILSRMSGTAVPAEWQGGLNFTYHLGPGFATGFTLLSGPLA